MNFYLVFLYNGDVIDIEVFDNEVDRDLEFKNQRDVLLDLGSFDEIQKLNVLK